VDAGAERVLEVSIAAEDGVGVDGLLEAVRRIERDLAPHILEHEAALGAGHLAALHGVSAGDVVGTGQRADDPVLEAQVELGRGPNGAAGRFGGEAVHRLDIPAEVPEDVNRVRMEGFEVEIGRAFGGVADPEGHVGEEQMTQAAFVLPPFGNVRGGGEAVVEVDAKAETLLAGFGHHLLRRPDLVGNRLLAEHVTAGLQGLHGGEVVIAPVFVAARSDAGNIGLQPLKHLRRIEETWDAVLPRRGLGPLGDDVANAHQLGQRILPVNPRMPVPNRPHPNDHNTKHDLPSLLSLQYRQFTAP